MTELDLISIQEAKDILVVDFEDTDGRIKTLIETAIAWVEQYTGYYLWQRDITIVTSFRDPITKVDAYPAEMKTAEDEFGLPVAVTVMYGSANTLYLRTPYNTVVTLTVGYPTKGQVPAPLLTAAHKLITYLYENVDAYSVGIPTDIQMLINQFRRNIL